MFKSTPTPQTRLATHSQMIRMTLKDCCHHLVVCCYSKCTCFSSSYDWEGTRVLKWLVVGVLMYTTCRVGVLSSEISKHSKISPPPSLRSHLTSSPMGVLSGDYGSSMWKICEMYANLNSVTRGILDISQRFQNGLREWENIFLGHAPRPCSQTMVHVHISIPSSPKSDKSAICMCRLYVLPCLGAPVN